MSLTLALGAVALASPASISDLSWMEGAWRGKAFGGEVEEIFNAPAGGCVLGVSRIIAPSGRLMQKEFMDISETDGKLTYTITLPSKTHTFAMAEIGPNRVVWSDPANDFPSRIGYSRKENIITIRLEGKTAAGEPRETTITMTKVEK
jgi:hypothetical protein